MVKKKIPKVVFFDMEGTIFKKVFKDSRGNTSPSAWTLIAKHLGEDALAEEDKTKDKWNSNEYQGYVEWMEDTIKVHQKYGLNKEVYDKVHISVVDDSNRIGAQQNNSLVCERYAREHQLDVRYIGPQQVYDLLQSLSEGEAGDLKHFNKDSQILTMNPRVLTKENHVIAV